jgi:hypothetical protein
MSTPNIFVLVDGLGWEWLRTIPFLSEMAPYRRPLKTVFGFSAGAIPSILTGSYPTDHGRMAMFHRVPQSDSPFRNFAWLCSMPPMLVENRYFRHLVEYGVKGLYGFGGHFDLYAVPLQYLPMLDVCEKQDIYQPGGIPGSTTIFDVLENKGVSYRSYSYHQGSDFQLVDMLERDLKADAADFYFVYFAGVDAYLHAHADQPELVAELLKQYELRLAKVYQSAVARNGHARFHLFSDHGMAPTSRTVDIMASLAALPFRAPRSYLALIDSTMARFWFSDDAPRKAIRANLTDGEDGRWLSKCDKGLLHADFSDNRYGEEIFLLNEGVVAEPSHMGAVAPRGMHGFHPSAPHSFASFISSEDYGSSMSSITDIFHVMCERS